MAYDSIEFKFKKSILLYSIFGINKLNICYKRTICCSV